MKTVQLKYQAALSEIDDLQKEHDREKEDFLDTIRSKGRECNFLYKVFEFLLPSKKFIRIKKQSKFDDEYNNEWHIKTFLVKDKHLSFQNLPKTQIIDNM